MLNVVNPPQKPTVKASLKAGVISVFSIKKKNKKPITKLPIIFTKKVEIGKLISKYLDKLKYKKFTE